MGSNNIPKSYDDVMSLTDQCITGAGTVGSGIPLVINTQAVITANRTTLLNTQASYKANCAALKGLYDAYHTQLDTVYLWCQQTRDYLKQYLGSSFNQAWVAAGFHNSIAVESSDAFLATLLGNLQTFFGNHTSWEDAAHNITAAQALALATALTNARAGVSAGKLACATSKAPRDAAYDAMRACLSGLVAELKQLIGPDDSRWLAFGLNVPGAPSTPEVPQNVTVNNATPGQFQVTCDASPNATRYRCYLQRPGIDLRPVLAGSSPAPLLVLTNLTPGQVYQVYMSAVDDNAESAMSAPITAQAQSQAA
ncbi:MAG: fibronectin type III domain-containing protein [Verrucomicrobia bacterium]|nr:fibronectin type III domain-containing protein [Verrucomicrobiota bacterium]